MNDDPPLNLVPAQHAVLTWATGRHRSPDLQECTVTQDLITDLLHLLTVVHLEAELEIDEAVDLVMGYLHSAVMNYQAEIAGDDLTDGLLDRGYIFHPTTPPSQHPPQLIDPACN